MTEISDTEAFQQHRDAAAAELRAIWTVPAGNAVAGLEITDEALKRLMVTKGRISDGDHASAEVVLLRWAQFGLITKIANDAGKLAWRREAIFFDPTYQRPAPATMFTDLNGETRSLAEQAVIDATRAEQRARVLTFTATDSNGNAVQVSTTWRTLERLGFTES